MPDFADLHIHSHFSDGLCSPGQIARQAGAIGLRAFAITDHDTLEGCAEAGRAAKEMGIDHVEGIEFSTRFEDFSVHVLGYLPPGGGRSLAPVIAEIQRNRRRRNEAIVARLRQLGIAIDPAKMQAAGPGQIGRPHIARLLCESKAVANEQEAFARYLRRGAKAFVPRRALGTEEAIGAIHRAGGVAVLAHAGTLGLSESYLRSMLDRFVSMGLDGVESCHPLHGKRLAVFLRRYCEQRGLVVSGGSDFHGRERDRSPLGECGRGRRVPLACFELIRNKVANRHEHHPDRR